METNQAGALRNAIGSALAQHQAGRLAEAEAAYRQILAADAKNSDALHLLGVVQLQRGQFDAAIDLIGKAIAIDPAYAPAFVNRSHALQGAGRYAEALADCDRVLAIKPDLADIHSNRGNALQGLHRYEEALASYDRELAVQPGHLGALYNRGNALHNLHRYAEALTSYDRALAVKPDFAEALYNRGVSLQSLERNEEALASYDHALAVKPDYIEALSNRGRVLQSAKRYTEALASHQKVLALRPEQVEDLVNCSRLHDLLGDTQMALAGARCAWGLQDSVLTRSNLFAILKKCRFSASNPEIEALAIRAMSEPWGRPEEAFDAMLSLVRLDKAVEACMKRASGAWPEKLSARDLFPAGSLNAVAKCRPLLCLLESVPSRDLDLEKFLDAARRAVLDLCGDADGAPAMDEEGLVFCCALAKQCYINEYVYSCDDAESSRAQALRDRLLVRCAEGLPVPALWLTTVASYFPLHTLPAVERTPGLPWPQAVAGLLLQQVSEPLAERQYRDGVPRLTGVNDRVSLLVRQQYEENPYPRWTRCTAQKKQLPFAEYLKQRFPRAAFAPPGNKRELDVLVAGCGTGLHPIRAAQTYAGARILAIDLSLSSLGYARRKTLELGIGNIDYAQADIMELASTKRSFDVIESVGVLHHMADPEAGWRELCALLRPGGFMRVGLYSEAARRDIVAARKWIAERKGAAGPQDIMKLRHELITVMAAGELASLASTADFFTTSECRDLLFHVHEQRFTLPRINKSLEALGLSLIGFQLPADTLSRYAERFPDDRSMTDMGNWDTFEHQNPQTFRAMYQFWMQKRI